MKRNPRHDPRPGDRAREGQSLRELPLLNLPVDSDHGGGAASPSAVAWLSPGPSQLKLSPGFTD